MNYASIGKRILASIIDSIVLNVLTPFLIIFGPFGILTGQFLLAALYHILFMGSSWHATLGQKAVNIQIIDEYGNGIDYAKATLRYIASWLSSAILGIGYLIALFDSSYQTLHDKLAGTYVIEAQAAQAVNVQRNNVNNGGGYVIGVSGEKAGMRFPITGNGIMIGRDPSVCHIIMGNSRGVSRLHCLISYNPMSRMYILSDRGSTYGTFTHQGERVTPDKSIALKSGERFYLGDRNNMFEVG